MGELGTRGTTERVHVGNSPPKVARAALLPDGDGFQRPLVPRSRFQPRLTPSVMFQGQEAMFEKEDLLEQLGDGYTNRVVERIRRFAFFPYTVLQSLARDALNEEWGNNLFVLEKYLAVHIPWSIEQGRYTHSHNQ